MTPNIYVSRDELTSPKFGEAFAQGSGGKIVSQYKPGPWAGFGSPVTWDSLVRARKAGNNFYYGDHAYFGRGKFYRVTKNAFQHTGIGKPDFARLFPFYEKEKKWKQGAHIVIALQTDNHYDRMGLVDQQHWLQSIYERLSLATDRKIIVRYSKKNTYKPLLHDLENAWCLITHTSNAAVEAILNGVPAICTGDCAASTMSLRDPINIENPYYPEERLKWAAVLAANQWTETEIRNGTCWKAIR